MTEPAYLKWQKAACLRASGLTIKRVAQVLDVSIGRARELIALGQDMPEPDEIIFAPFLKLDTPIRFLPVKREIRDALEEVGVATMHDLMAHDWSELAGRLLRFPKIGRKKIGELEEVLRQESGEHSSAARQQGANQIASTSFALWKPNRVAKYQEHAQIVTRRT
jgi:hypothetical protein